MVTRLDPTVRSMARSPAMGGPGPTSATPTSAMRQRCSPTARSSLPAISPADQTSRSRASIRTARSTRASTPVEPPATARRSSATAARLSRGGAGAAGRQDRAGRPRQRDVDFAVTRLNPDGSFDGSFDGDGTGGADFGAVDHGLAAALQPDGKILVAGYTSVNRRRRGRALQPRRQARRHVRRRRQEDVRVRWRRLRRGCAGAAGRQDRPRRLRGCQHRLTVTRLNPDGSFDTSFDGDGTSGADFGGADHGHAVLLQPNGKIVVAGTAVGSNPTSQSCGCSRAGRSTPRSASTARRRSTSAVTTRERAALQPDGKILIAGKTSLR